MRSSWRAFLPATRRGTFRSRGCYRRSSRIPVSIPAHSHRLCVSTARRPPNHRRQGCIAPSGVRSRSVCHIHAKVTSSLPASPARSLSTRVPLQDAAARSSSAGAGAALPLPQALRCPRYAPRAINSRGGVCGAEGAGAPWSTTASTGNEAGWIRPSAGHRHLPCEHPRLEMMRDRLVRGNSWHGARASTVTCGVGYDIGRRCPRLYIAG